MGNEKIRANKSPENDPAEVGDGQSRRGVGKGREVQTPETGLPLSRARTPAWSRMVLPAQLHLLSATAVTPRNPRCKGSPFRERGSLNGQTDLSSFAGEEMDLQRSNQGY